MNIKTYPECEKLSQNREKINDLMEFLGFINKQGLRFGEMKEHLHGYLNPVNLEREGEVLAAQFLGIDMDQVDKERKEIEKCTRV